jgi:RimJ/RimL family protein N-acetyltransferase
LLRLFRSSFDTGKEFVYGIFDREEKVVLGGCGLHRRAGPEALEIGYWLDRDHIGKGLAREAAKALVTAAFGVEGIDRIEIHHDPRNLRSRAIPEALGFAFESLRRRNNTAFAGEFRDSSVWTFYREHKETP